MLRIISAIALTASKGDAELIRTPAGLWPAECVHTVPDGTQISHDRSGVHYKYPDGTEGFRPNCTSAPHPDLPRRHRQREVAAGSSDVANSSGIEAHGYPVILWGESDSPLQKFTATYNVPEAPANFANQTIFWWLGVESQSASDVLQPVLGYNGLWTFASWNCCPAGHQHTGSVINVNTGDSLYGSLVGTGDLGYTVLSEYNGKKSTLQSNDAIPQVMPLLSMEVYNADCSLLPQSCMTMSQISISPSTTFGSNSPRGFGLASSCGWSLDIKDDTLSACPPGVPEANIVV